MSDDVAGFFRVPLYDVAVLKLKQVRYYCDDKKTVKHHKGENVTMKLSEFNPLYLLILFLYGPDPTLVACLFCRGVHNPEGRQLPHHGLGILPGRWVKNE